MSESAAEGNAAPVGGESFFSVENFKVAQVNIICGMLTGYSIGYVAVYSTLYDMSNTCSLYTSRTACETLSNAKCEWLTMTDDSIPNYNELLPFCGWRGQARCQTFKEESSCTTNADCNWNYNKNNCDNVHGYSAVESGIFAGALVLGCMTGGMSGGLIGTKLGPKRCFLTVGVVSLICSVLYHVSAAINNLWLLVVARVIIGFMVGICCVAGPTYVTINAAPRFSKSIGVLYQVFTTFGIFFASIVGLVVGQTVEYGGGDQKLSARMQAICAFNTLISLILLVMLGVLLPAEDQAADLGAEEVREEPNEREYSWLSMAGPLFLGMVASGTSQMTGVNAVMNYAPTMMDSLGMAPLVGNLVVMAVNFVMTLGSIPLASHFSMRTMFLWGSAVCSVSCLLLCGVPVYPGVASENVKDGVAITGILIFITAFELGVGPCFYVLSQDLYPPSFRPKGASWTMFIQFLFNLIINVFYPIATKAVSGGPSGNQNKGQAVAFMFFGAIGVVCFVLQVFFLFPWEDPKEYTDDGRIDHEGSDAGNAADEAAAGDLGGKSEPVSEEDRH